MQTHRVCSEDVLRRSMRLSQNPPKSPAKHGQSWPLELSCQTAFCHRLAAVGCRTKLSLPCAVDMVGSKSSQTNPALSAAAPLRESNSNRLPASGAFSRTSILAWLKEETAACLRWPPARMETTWSTGIRFAAPAPQRNHDVHASCRGDDST